MIRKLSLVAGMNQKLRKCFSRFTAKSSFVGNDLSWVSEEEEEEEETEEDVTWLNGLHAGP